VGGRDLVGRDRAGEVEALAERADLSPRSIQKLERGETLPYPVTVQRLARVLGLRSEERAQFQAAGARIPKQTTPASSFPYAALGDLVDALPRGTVTFLLLAVEEPPRQGAVASEPRTGVMALAFDTFACGLLDGETDTSGYPEYNAVVGGVAAHWDEATGDMICRAVVGWGGKGVRGDTDRIGARILSGLLTNVLANQYALGLTAVERPVPAGGRGGLVCAHCGFASAHERAFYCPKCGMRLLRG
jgi:transcriptional regulator with XRE-family HTH domain